MEFANRRIILAFCWAHQRRDFLNIANSYPELEGWAFEWIVPWAPWEIKRSDLDSEKIKILRETGRLRIEGVDLGQQECLFPNM